MYKIKENRGGDGKFIDGSIPWNKNKRIPLDINFIKKRYINDELSTYDIAKELNTTQKTIYNRLKENNIEIRKNTTPTKQTKQKIKQTLIRKGIQPTIRYSGEPTSGCFKKGRTSWNKDKTGLQISTKKGKNFEEFYGEQKAKKIRQQIKEKRKTQITPVKDTKIELKIQDLLTALKIEFMTHKYMNIKYGYQCDIFIPAQANIPQKTIIECDGDYWHGNLDIFPINKMSQKRKCKRCLDYERTAQLEEEGFNVIRLWESEIKPMNKNDLQTVLNK